MARSLQARLEQEEDSRLAPWAMRSSGATRRHPLPAEGRAVSYRTAFQRDRDRVVYSRAFRRLRQKALAGLLPEYEDHRRNRLTHTLEVAQLARTIGRALGLSEDLVESIALAHDLGQPPFGRAGARSLDDLMTARLDGRGGPDLGDLGGFRRSWQSLRVVDLLEKRYDHPGLNLTDPVREGVAKAAADTGDGIPEDVDGIRRGLPPLFETQVVSLADRMATALSDLDDALQAGAVDVARVERLSAVRRLRQKLGAGYPPGSGRFMKANAIHRGLTHLLVTGAIVHSRRRLDRWAERHDVRASERLAEVADEAVRGDEVGLPPRAEDLLADLEGFLEARVRRGRGPDQVEARGRRVLLGLFAAYHNDPGLLEDHVLLRFRQAAGRPFLRDVAWRDLRDEVDRFYRPSRVFARMVCDYLAGMTDSYALAEHRRLLEMAAVPIPGAEQLKREAHGSGRRASGSERDSEE
jgi:dGTPase